MFYCLRYNKLFITNSTVIITDDFVFKYFRVQGSRNLINKSKYFHTVIMHRVFLSLSLSTLSITLK